MKPILPIKSIKKVPMMKSLCASAFLISSVYIASTSFDSAAGVCTQQVVNVKQVSTNTSFTQHCLPKGNKVSWVAWFTNKSSSNQFHFLDLLELLSQSSSDDE